MTFQHAPAAATTVASNVDVQSEPVPPAQQGLIPSTLSMIERLATDARVDVDRLERMMALHERLIERQAREQYAADYVRMKPNLPLIIRTKDNTQTRSKYAPLEDVNGQVDPILNQYGFGTS